MNDERPRLTRSHDRTLGGVAAGIADYVAVDPTLIRVFFVIAFFVAFGSIVLVYIALWFIMPEPSDDPDVEGESGERAAVSLRGADPALILGGALVVIGALLLFNELAVDRFFGCGLTAVAWPVLLIAGGAALVLRARDRVAR